MPNETLQVQGTVTLRIWRGGELIAEEGHNLVVNLGKANVAKLLAGDAAGKAITQLAVGTNGAAATVGDTALTGQFAKPLTGHSYPAGTTSVQFSFELNSGEANGMTIREFGLLTSDGTLFARKIRETPIVKTTDVRFEGTWRIKVI